VSTDSSIKTSRVTPRFFSSHIRVCARDSLRGMATLN